MGSALDSAKCANAWRGLLVALKRSESGSPRASVAQDRADAVSYQSRVAGRGCHGTQCRAGSAENFAPIGTSLCDVAPGRRRDTETGNFGSCRATRRVLRFSGKPFRVLWFGRATLANRRGLARRAETESQGTRRATRPSLRKGLNLSKQIWREILDQEMGFFDPEKYRSHVPELVEEVAKPYHLDRSSIFLALGELGTVAEGALPALKCILLEKDPEMRALAAVTISKIQDFADDFILDLLQESLQDYSFSTLSVGFAIRQIADRVAQNGLRENDSPRCIEKLQAMLEEMCKQDNVRGLHLIALKSIEKLRLTDSIDRQVLVRLAKDSSPYVASQAKQMLEGLKNPGK